LAKKGSYRLTLATAAEEDVAEAILLSKKLEAYGYGGYRGGKHYRKWIPVQSNLYFRDAVMAFNCMTGMAPEYLSDKCISRGSVSGRATRNSQQLNIP
jgi:hypothetical protein